MSIIVWVVSKFRVSPGIDVIFTALFLLMGYGTLEAVIQFQLWILKTKVKLNNNMVRTVSLLGSILAGTLTFIGLFYVFKWLDHWVNNSEVPMMPHMVTAALVGVTMSIIFALIQFLTNWKHEYYQSHIQNEWLKKEITRNNLTILKNQLDPHFMFNSFNTLYYLIDENSAVAKQFLQNMSSIYRYILQHNEESIIPAQKEYEMAKQYLEILQQRYGECLQVVDTVNVQDLVNQSLPPLVLQQLMENAIKHNRIDEESDLKIELLTANNRFIVKNNRNPKKSPRTTRTGLKNIQNRYKMLTKLPVFIDERQDKFEVAVPLISHADGA